MKHRAIVSITSAAAIAFAIGMTAPAKPANAHHIYFGFGFGHHNYHHCHKKWVRVKVWSKKYHKRIWVWQLRRVCW